MGSILSYLLFLSLAIHVLLISVALWRIWRGENIIDRLMGADLMGTLTLAIVVLVALITRNSIYVDVALGLAAVGFIGIIALAKYVADEQMF